MGMGAAELVVAVSAVGAWLGGRGRLVPISVQQDGVLDGSLASKLKREWP